MSAENEKPLGQKTDRRIIFNGDPPAETLETIHECWFDIPTSLNLPPTIKHTKPSHPFMFSLSSLLLYLSNYISFISCCPCNSFRLFPYHPTDILAHPVIDVVGLDAVLSGGAGEGGVFCNGYDMSQLHVPLIIPLPNQEEKSPGGRPRAPVCRGATTSTKGKILVPEV